MKLAQYFNKTILVCIPSLYDDGQPRPYKLVGIEPEGLWLESEELVSRLLPANTKHSPPETLRAFIPFAQISYILEATYAVAPAPSPVVSEVPEEAPRAPALEAEQGEQHSTHHGGTRARHKKTS